MTSPTVLYVEDESDDIFFMRTAFSRLGLAERLHAVDDGLKAISWLAGEAPFKDRSSFPFPRVMLLDLNLPLRSGFEVLQWLRSREQFDQLAVVIFSGSGRPGDRAKASALGATDYVLKPQSGFQFTDLVRHVEATWLTSGS